MSDQSGPAQKITYTSAHVDMEAFHGAFDDALDRLREALGGDHPSVVDGEEIAGDAWITDVTPIDTSVTLGRFAAAGAEDVDRAVRVAARVQEAWDARGWRERIGVLRRAAGLIRERKYDLAALMSLEVGKSRLEAMGDAEEAADLIDYYCDQMEAADGFVRTMDRITDVERNTDHLRPFGVFACIAPFNFPLALSAGMSSAALVAGNAVVYKPAEQAPWTGQRLYQVYRDAGIPAGVFHLLHGDGSVGEALWRHDGVDGVVFTGSREVGHRIHRHFSESWIKPCLLELGGKNAAIVTDTADLEAAAEGVARGAWGLQNQKCSATSRVYAHPDVRDPFVELLLERTGELEIGDPTERDVNFGPVIEESSVRRYQEAVERARKEGEVVTGGRRLTDGPLARGHYVAPTVATLPLESPLFRDELFVPFLAVGEVESLDRAIEETNAADYGLTAGIFTGRSDEVERFFREVEAGVCYVNKHTGATTGAWPGAQPFCGWKASGSTGKGGCGPYYVAQFMREQSRTVIGDLP
ncbi:MAG: aldehyde dehydrogenase family protein [Gemmatimonadetes bacterium]|nr:aldehyde dehydrogenase family protein [Gemmatimonadota bacterium]NIR80940.1 aldehyde dehydrogenase family protein [Gemmatimonadota bacterium]NIT89758.1 aldehyde dehydrogenase family protein [Gemmatimonadota bacterium]NIU33544.1 aldehyde dehydrogenase family protein [Gemmatimonadota bacterium]NIU37814.1 aldehyde dehydrogenase family protein [Gemmatimonadota bacterium]